MNGAIVFNKYYSDSGMDYIRGRFKETFSEKGSFLTELNIYAEFSYPRIMLKQLENIDFVLFFDKDVSLADFLEKQGIRVYNSKNTIEICDDKSKTYSKIFSLNIAVPKTIISPLMYDVNNSEGEDFLKYVTTEIEFPIVVKQNTGSQGKQVYLANNMKELKKLFSDLKHIPHMYQQFVGSQKGSDIRVYIIGKQAKFCVQRSNTTDFRSNISLGGSMKGYELDNNLKMQAEIIAKELSLEYGSVDFIEYNNTYYFIESNSNAYLKTVEKLYPALAKDYTEYVLSHK